MSLAVTRPQWAAVRQQQNAAQAQETQLLATVEFSNVVATAYDPTGRTITISGEIKSIGEVVQQQARTFVLANASNSKGMAASTKKHSTELGAAVPELASQGKQGQLMSPPGSESASACQPGPPDTLL